MPKRLFFILFFGFLGCSPKAEQVPPVLGAVGAHGQKSSFNTSEYEFINQDGKCMALADMEGKIRIVDFFFTSCPSICPKMTTNLQQVQQHFSNKDEVAIFSFSIDVINDSPSQLAAYAKKYNINSQSWNLLTGSGQEIFAWAKELRLMAFEENWANEQNLIHDGTFVLLDEQSRVRGYYDGLDEKDTGRLIRDMEKLIQLEQ